jgi:hypothetical protein
MDEGIGTMGYKDGCTSEQNFLNLSLSAFQENHTYLFYVDTDLTRSSRLFYYCYNNPKTYIYKIRSQRIKA